MAEHKQEICNITSTQWYNYFCSLLSKEPCVDRCQVCEDDEPNISNKAVDLDELVNCVKSLPNGKAAGVDGIPYEMLKASLPKIEMSLVKFFNSILGKDLFPEEWTKGMISTILKKRFCNRSRKL